MKPNRWQRTFRKRALKEIKANGMTQSELSIRSKCTESSISHYLDGDVQKARLPRIDAAARIATALGVSVDYLFGLTDERRPWEVSCSSPKEVFSTPKMEIASDGPKQPCPFRFVGKRKDNGETVEGGSLLQVNGLDGEGDFAFIGKRGSFGILNMRGDNITSINLCNIVGVDPGSVEIITEG